MSDPASKSVHITLRLDFAALEDAPRVGRVGPGKVTLLEGIVREGSISAAARAQGLSYRRAWLMIDEMNRLFRDPVVEAGAGGARGGQAALTELGKALVAAYRTLEDETAARAETVLKGLVGKVTR